MKYYKRHSLDTKSPTSNVFAAQADGTLVTTSVTAIEIPEGTTAQRPIGSEGMIRYNSDLHYFESFTQGVWAPFQAKAFFTIHQDEFDNGDYADIYFGPLTQTVSTTTPQNVLVYIENVPQLSGLNYILVNSTAGNHITTSTVLTILAPVNTTTLHVTSVADFNQSQSITGSGITTLTTVIATSVTDLTITLSLPISSPMNTGTVVTSTLSTGTWVKFTNNSIPVPNKPVVVLSGFAGNIAQT
jgi:hypothetical protein